jgi:hypothetical protein
MQGRLFHGLLRQRFDGIWLWAYLLLYQVFRGEAEENHGNLGLDIKPQPGINLGGTEYKVGIFFTVHLF